MVLSCDSDVCIFSVIFAGTGVAMTILWLIEKAIENKYKKMRKEYTNERKKHG